MIESLIWMMEKFVKISTIRGEEFYGKVLRLPNLNPNPRTLPEIYNSYDIALVARPWFNVRIVRIWQREIAEVIELDEVQCKLLAG